MTWRESLRFAIRGVLANKLRSLLTMSGILIGVAAVIILLAAGTARARRCRSRSARWAATR
jgi:putative ABC transport system permease protein